MSDRQISQFLNFQFSPPRRLATFGGLNHVYKYVSPHRPGRRCCTACTISGGYGWQPDPIFAAIERHRIAEAAYLSASLISEDTDHHDQWNSYAALLAFTPTTIAGCAALLRYVEDQEAIAGAGLFDECSDPVNSAGHRLLSRVAAALEKFV
jgi:hypothetical protein